MRILLPTDGSPPSQAALEFLAALPLPAATPVRLVSVVATVLPAATGFPDAAPAAMESYGEVIAAERQNSNDAIEAAKQRLSGSSLEVSAEVREGDPEHEILEAAEAFAADLILLGTRGPTGLEEFFLGSVARGVARHAKRPVLVARGAHGGLNRILLASDGSENSREAAAFLASLPLPEAAVTRVVYVLKPYDPFPGILPTDRAEFEAEAEEVRERQRQVGEHIVSVAASALKESGKLTETEVRLGSPTEEILEAAKETGADLIVAGARGESMLHALLVGSVAEKLLKQHKGSVLVVH